MKIQNSDSHNGETMDSNNTIQSELGLRSKNFFKEACKNIKGPDRKNVPKYIINAYAKFVKEEKVFDELKIYWDISKNQYEIIKNVFENCLSIMNSHQDEKIKKDYVNLIDQIISIPILHHIFNSLLRNLLNNFDNKGYGKISQKGLETYKNTIQLLYEKSKDFLKKMYEIKDLSGTKPISETNGVLESKSSCEAVSADSSFK